MHNTNFDLFNNDYKINNTINTDADRTLIFYSAIVHVYRLLLSYRFPITKIILVYRVSESGNPKQLISL